MIHVQICPNEPNALWQDYETIFISVKNAHLVLGDQATRRQYDKEGMGRGWDKRNLPLLGYGAGRNIMKHHHDSFIG